MRGGQCRSARIGPTASTFVKNLSRDSPRTLPEDNDRLLRCEGAIGDAGTVMDSMYDRYRELVAGTTIDGGTLLSTDYFNSFNEVIMLLGMVPEMPAMLEEVQAWRFRTYEEHFRASG